uniref:C2H2-type domain-containing protein n=1 Tax=Glossina palpalis gambiensis TaxID=67801 RepID=A0A1B0BTA4_9MUSC
MDLNLEDFHQICRVCLQKGDVNLYDCKVKLRENSEGAASEKYLNLTIAELMEIFINSKTDLLELDAEVPSMCWDCLEDLKFCYGFYNKLRSANSNLKYLYQECLNNVIQYIEDGQELKEEWPEDELSSLIIEDLNEVDSQDTLEDLKYTRLSSETNKFIPSTTTKSLLTPRDNVALMVTKFFPTTVGNNAKSDETEPQLAPTLLTADYKVVEVNDLRNLQTLEYDGPNSKTDAIYKCQYCPQAFANLEYLKTHLQTTHLCKFCTQAFNLSGELFKHIREVHKECKCKCAICHKRLSSHCNLRSHIRRVHGVKLPPKMALIDFVRKTPKESDDDGNKELETSDGIDLETDGLSLKTCDFGYNSESMEIN